MGAADNFVAEGKAYATAARRKEEAGEKEAARDLYLQAAESYLNASKASSDKDEKEFRANMAQTFYGKAVSMRPQARRAQSSGGPGDGGADEEKLREVVPIEKPNINFANVGGLDAVKEEIRKAIVYPFRHPEIFELYGKRAGEGILLYGPPGCGKTFIARAAAGECNANFLTMTISEILSKWVGDSERNVRAAFESARKYAPAILFFDEIDAVGGRRDEAREGYAKRLVNEMLINLDGVQGPLEKVLVLAGTNSPWDVDPALRRPGRFSKLVFVPPPDRVSRAQILRIHMKERPIDPSVDIDELSARTDGFSSADLAQICIEAADAPLMEALSGKQPRKINRDDFMSVLQKRGSSLYPWFKLARQEIEHSGEQEIFSELLKSIDYHLAKLPPSPGATMRERA
ncbi:MAG: AAA family ATPase [Euryarchaeota archaeon]|nr:AAA family ATPase [Euryarchaeota archaeon]